MPSKVLVGSTLKISAAKEELECFQVIIPPTSQYSSIIVSISMFPNLGSGILGLEMGGQ